MLYDLKGSDLISKSYRYEQIRLHNQPRGYGGRGKKWATCVAELVIMYDATSVLDYGCGQGSLKKALGGTSKILRIDEYDPAIKGKDKMPVFADIVNCTDVLEHVEPDRLDTVLKHIRVLTRKAAFVVASVCETSKTLSDGRQAHLTVEPADWWVNRVQAVGFTVCPPPALARSRPDKEWVAVLLP